MSETQKKLEIELKLLIGNESMGEEIIGFLQSIGYRLGSERIGIHTDTYLDTFDWQLFKNRMALRFRRKQDSVRIMIKGVSEVVDGVSRRIEIEQDTGVSILRSMELPKGEIADLVRGIIDGKNLIPHLVIRTERREYPVTCPDQTTMLLALDRSLCSSIWIEGSPWSSPRYEFEAELVNGNDNQIELLRDTLVVRFGLLQSGSSKLESAIVQLGLAGPSKMIPVHLAVQPDDRLHWAAKKILRHQFERFVQYRNGVLRELDVECVHQARVSVRRMRSALKLFRNSFSEGMTRYCRKELAWIARELGQVRDLDVMLKRIESRKEHLEAVSKLALRTIRSMAESDRRKHLKALNGRLKSMRYSIFVKRFHVFLKQCSDPDSRNVVSGSAVSDIAPVLILKRLKSVLAAQRALAREPLPRLFHQLRIEIKQLRYACEFFTGVLSENLGAFVKKLIVLQDTLGDMQDTVFIRDVILGYCKNIQSKRASNTVLFDIGRIYQLQHQDYQNLRIAFESQWNEAFNRSARRALRSELESQLPVPGAGQIIDGDPTSMEFND